MQKLFAFVTEQDHLCVVSIDQDDQDSDIPPFVSISVAESLGSNPEQITITQSDMDALCGHWLANNPDKAVK